MTIQTDNKLLLEYLDTTRQRGSRYTVGYYLSTVLRGRSYQVRRRCQDRLLAEVARLLESGDVVAVPSVSDGTAYVRRADLPQEAAQ